MSLMKLLTFVLPMLATAIAGKLSEHMIQIAEEFADQLVAAMNLSGIERLFVWLFVWLGAAVLVILFVIVPLAWLGRLTMPEMPELNTKTA